MVYRCTVCGYEYDEASEGKSWDSLPDDWICPVCGVGKELFEKIQTEEAPIKQEEARAPQPADTSAASCAASETPSELAQPNARKQWLIGALSGFSAWSATRISEWRTQSAGRSKTEKCAISESATRAPLPSRAPLMASSQETPRRAYLLRARVLQTS